MKKINKSIKRELRNRKKLKSVAVNRYRISVFKSLKNISAQIIDDKAKKTLVSVSSIEKEIKANKKKIKEHLDNSLMLVTALAPIIGYDEAAKIAKTALKNNTTLKYETLKLGLINEKEYNKIVDPKKMISPKK